MTLTVTAHNMAQIATTQMINLKFHLDSGVKSQVNSNSELKAHTVAYDLTWIPYRMTCDLIWTLKSDLKMRDSERNLMRPHCPYITNLVINKHTVEK